MSLRLSVVIVAFNEAPALREVLAGLQRELPAAAGGAFEVIVVDDGSTDETSTVARSAGVIVVQNCNRLGSGASRRQGARATRGELVAWMDGDGTYPVEALVAALRALGEADQAIGVRSVDHGRLSGVRMAVKGILASFAAKLWRTPIPDLNTGLRVFRRTAMMSWIDELPDGFSCTTTATLAALNHHQTLVFIPIDYRPRASGTRSKFHPLWDTLRLMRAIWRMWRRRKQHLV